MSQDPHDQVLTCRVDPKLSTSKQYPETAPAEIQRPPGVSTLRDWGQLKMSSGKHGGKTFEQAHTDLCYVRQMWNRKEVSAWVRSFQMYCRARSQMTSEYAFKMQEMGVEVDLVGLQTQVTTANSSSHSAAPKPISKPKAVAQLSQSKASQEEWINIEEEVQTKSEPRRTTKRGSSKPKTTSMATEINATRVQELRTQIAILQRELAREEDIPEEEDI
jgi:hypothetical protein